MVFSPWYNYGMYSEVIKPQSSYVVTKVYADEQLLKGPDFSPQAWDRIHFNLQLAVASSCNKHFYEKEIKRIIRKFHMPVPGESHYVNLISSDDIFQRNKQLLAQQLKRNSVEVYSLEYSWSGKTLVFNDSLPTLPVSHFLCQ